MCVCVYVCMCVYIYVCVCIYIHMFTYLHILLFIFNNLYIFINYEYSFFLLNGIFGDIEFYYFLLINHDSIILNE